MKQEIQTPSLSWVVLPIMVGTILLMGIWN